MMAIQMSHRLQVRISQIFQKLIAKWLVESSVVEFFVFELKGFDFLLETIGTTQQQTTREASSPTKIKS